MIRRWPWIVHLPRMLVVLHDLLMVVATWVMLRWLAGQAGAPPTPFLLRELAIAVAIQGVVFWRVGLYRGVWRFASMPDLVNLASAAFIGVLFTSSLLIEVIFSLDGLGLLGFEATINRDYPVMLGSLFIFSLLGLIANLLGDVTYTLVDPRIDFERRDV